MSTKRIAFARHVGFLIYDNLFRPMMLPSCRFVPTCSEYAREAVHRFGLVRGGWKTARRLARCHPFGPCGADPVR